jgi:glucokinase
VYSIGIDIGGTKIAGALVDAEGRIHSRFQVPSPAHDAAAMVETIAGLIEQISDGQQVIAAGVAAAGYINADQSMVYYAPNIAWRNEPLKELLEQRTHIPIVIENDANAAGWAEFRFGAGKDFSHMTMLTVGTGVGGAIIANGELFTGGFGTAAELGHLRVEPGGLLCGCGQQGCLEQYASGRALLRYMREETGIDDLDAEAGKVLLENGDEAAWRAMRTVGIWLGAACASLSAVLDPQVYVIGGGVAAAGNHFLSPIKEAFLSNLSAQGYHPEPEFRIAELVNDAGVVGAADLARKHAQRLRE